MPSWRYVIPNLVTCVSLACGVLSLAASVEGRLADAAWFVLLCVLLDKADGTAARLLKATSAFGLQMDSLADLVTFGVAPAVMVLCVPAQPATHQLLAGGALGATLVHWGAYAAAIVYVACAALRLAKFNVSTRSSDTHFAGIPTTLSGAILTGYFLSVTKYQLAPYFVLVLPALAVVLALLMVSRLPLPKLSFRHHWAINAIQGVNLVCVYVFGLLRVFPEYLLAVALVYLLVGGTFSLVGGAARTPLMPMSEASSPPKGSS